MDESNLLKSIDGFGFDPRLEKLNAGLWASTFVSIIDIQLQISMPTATNIEWFLGNDRLVLLIRTLSFND